MSQGGIIAKKGEFTLVHYSVSSAVKLIYKYYAVDEFDNKIEFEEELWLDYVGLQDLAELSTNFIKQIGL